ncbi:hypothetical protein K449DRAFT_439617 [Hypoxylon sp. EC38]|nr:hypothetical protein K449DRAFT_439617 [Hypoxylon sp. EC38]
MPFLRTQHRSRRSLPPLRLQIPSPPPAEFYLPHNIDTTLDVAIYRPIDPRDPHHWAIAITSPTHRKSVHQIHDDIGGRGYYVADARWRIRPNRARLFRVSVFIGRIR